MTSPNCPMYEIQVIKISVFHVEGNNKNICKGQGRHVNTEAYQSKKVFFKE